MKIIPSIPGVCILALGTFLPVTLVCKPKPNVIVILADDLGYSDLGCFGGEMKTPALDNLAKGGVRFTQFQNSGMSVCSRASLLTGQWWPQGVREFSKTTILPQKMKQAGYTTALIGKWHQAGDPMDRGFDHFFGFLGGGGSHFDAIPDFRIDREAYNAFPPNYYSSDAFTDRAIDFVKKSNTHSDTPFFLYLSYQAPHNPLQAPDKDILRNRGKYMGGWQKVRQARFERMKQMGIVNTDAILPDYPLNLPKWDELSEEQKDLEDLRMAVYAAMIERMDFGIERLMHALHQTGQDKNTIILFMSDNGTDSFFNTDQAMLSKDLLPGDRGSNWQLGRGWAYASVTPWRLYKISQHAGGITSGAIAWGAPLASKKGSIETQLLHMVDIMPTLNELTGVDKDPDLAGESFLPLLRGNKWVRTKPLYFQFMDNRAIRTPQWSLVEVDNNGWELYDRKADPLEIKDLALQNPDMVQLLDSMWNSWWIKDSGKVTYTPQTTKNNQHYNPQGDRGSGVLYTPTAMPERLKLKYPIMFQ